MLFSSCKIASPKSLPVLLFQSKLWISQKSHHSRNFFADQDSTSQSQWSWLNLAMVHTSLSFYSPWLRVRYLPYSLLSTILKSLERNFHSICPGHWSLWTLIRCLKHGIDCQGVAYQDECYGCFELQRRSFRREKITGMDFQGPRISPLQIAKLLRPSMGRDDMLSILTPPIREEGPNMGWTPMIIRDHFIFTDKGYDVCSFIKPIAMFLCPTQGGWAICLTQ